MDKCDKYDFGADHRTASEATPNQGFVGSGVAFDPETVADVRLEIVMALIERRPDLYYYEKLIHEARAIAEFVLGPNPKAAA